VTDLQDCAAFLAGGDHPIRFFQSARDWFLNQHVNAASSKPQPISQCDSVGTAKLTASTLPISVRQSVVTLVEYSPAIRRPCASSRSQTLVNCSRPSAASAA